MAVLAGTRPKLLPLAVPRTIVNDIVTGFQVMVDGLPEAPKVAVEPPFTKPLSPRFTEPKWNPPGPHAGTATVRMSIEDGVPSLATVTTTPVLRALVVS